MRLEVKKKDIHSFADRFQLYVNEELVFETPYVYKLAKKVSEYVKLRFGE